MININRFSELLVQLQTEVNELIAPGNWMLEDGYWLDNGTFDDNAVWEDLPIKGRKIDEVILAVSESQAQEQINGKKGILLIAKMPAATSDIQSIDEYSEDNHCLIFVLEKIEIGKLKAQKRVEHYAKLQRITTMVKEWIFNHGLNNGESDGSETLSKPFQTEWEYQIYGNFNGLSIGFDIKDFAL